MKIKKWIISFMITLLLLIPISRSPNNGIISDVHAETINPSQELRNLMLILIGTMTTVGITSKQLTDNFITNVSNGVSSAVDIYNQLNTTVENWKAENFVSQGTYTNNPILIPKDLLKKFNAEIRLNIINGNYESNELSETVINQFENHFYETWFHHTAYYELAREELIDTYGKPFIRFKMASFGQNTTSASSLFLTSSKILTFNPTVKNDLMTVSDFINGGYYTTTSLYINDIQLNATNKQSILDQFGNEYLAINILLGSSETNTWSGVAFNVLQTNPNYVVVPHIQNYKSSSSYQTYTLQYYDRVLGFDTSSVITETPDTSGNTSITNNITNNAVINNYGESLNKQDTSIALPTSPDAWSDKTNDETVIPPYTGSLPTLQDGVLTNTDGSVYPLPQFPTPAIDVSWDILATLQNLFSWLAAVLKWIIDMGIYALYMILAQLGLTQYFNIVIEFFKSIFDLLLSGFKFLFRSLSTLPDFFKFLIALLALIFDSILKFINLIITLIIHTFYDLINSALLSYTSITRLLPSPLNSVANATVGLVTSFLTFKVIKNIIGGLRS